MFLWVLKLHHPGLPTGRRLPYTGDEGVDRTTPVSSPKTENSTETGTVFTVQESVTTIENPTGRVGRAHRTGVTSVNLPPSVRSPLIPPDW